MLRFLADENFNNQIVRGVLRQNPNVDVVRVQDVALSEADDPTVLEWAAQQGRVVLTHDVSTMTRFAYERIQAGLSMPGLLEVSRRVPVSLAIEEILLLGKYGSYPCGKSSSMRSIDAPPIKNAIWLIYLKRKDG